MSELMSLIRQVIPNTIANDIVNVQPMSLNIGSTVDYGHQYETAVERMLRVDFGGVDKDVIIAILKEKFPENFI